MKVAKVMFEESDGRVMMEISVFPGRYSEIFRIIQKYFEIFESVEEK